MLATAGSIADVARGGADAWIVERKLDGLRCAAVRDGDNVELWSRNHLPFTQRFPGLVAALAAVPADRFVADGEIVAFEGERSSFGLLGRPGPSTTISLVAFDLTHLLGSDISQLPLQDRRRLLGMTLDGAGAAVTVSGELDGEVEVLLADACARGWEGLVAKQRFSPYLPGRSRAWRKLKCVASQELVIGGWTEPHGSRVGLGALLVGFHDESGLRYAGRVGTGFDDATLRDLRARLAAMEMPGSPFVDLAALRGVHWVRPELVAAVGFGEWTRDDKLRHPRFEGLRADVDAALVVRDAPPGGA